MLESIRIQNYKCFSDLEIKSLGRINLITGKNNVGKTALLEAIALFASKGRIKTILEILEGRGHNYITRNRDELKKEEVEERNIKSLSSLFHGRPVDYPTKIAISISACETGYGKSSVNTDIVIDFGTFQPRSPLTSELDPENHSTNLDSRSAEDSIIRANQVDAGRQVITMLISVSQGGKVVGSNKMLSIDGRIREWVIPISEEASFSIDYKFISTKDVDYESSANYFDKITLTDKEDVIIKALRIIDPGIERIAFIGDESRYTRGRKPVVKHVKYRETIPLQSMGDGISRILSIIMAMVNTEKGILLIDEFENGLHYSVQQQLWKIIAKLAVELDIQVFATTHSQDSIAAFSKEMGTPDDELVGKLFRLEQKGDTIKAVEFTEAELKIAQEHNIEIR